MAQGSPKPAKNLQARMGPSQMMEVGQHPLALSTLRLATSSVSRVRNLTIGRRAHQLRLSHGDRAPRDGDRDTGPVVTSGDRRHPARDRLKIWMRVCLGLGQRSAGRRFQRAASMRPVSAGNAWVRWDAP
jgi:hypothetical protein